MYGYFRREVFCLCSLLVGLWPFFTAVPRWLAGAWLATCTALGAFTLLPEEFGDHVTLVVVGALLLVGGVGLYAWQFARTRRQRAVILAQCALVLLATLVVAHTMYEFSQKRRLPTLNQSISWVILGTPPSLLLERSGGWCPCGYNVAHSSSSPLCVCVRMCTPLSCGQ